MLTGAIFNATQSDKSSITQDEYCSFNALWIPTHDGQSSSLGQLALGPFKHLKTRAVQFTAVDGAVSRADPIKPLSFKVDGEA